MSYFFAAVSTRENLEKCEELALAGFPSTNNGVWAYVDVEIDDFLSFLYGGRAHGLYKVVKKNALRNPESLSFWEPIHSSKRDIYFPYLLRLKPIRKLDEPLARSEFLYITEDLLRRGGIRKSHFQADKTTLQNVSQMGKVSDREPEPPPIPQNEKFKPRFVKDKEKVDLPEVNHYREKILQAILRHHLSKPSSIESFFEDMELPKFGGGKFEVLSEKALESGHLDILIKEAEPAGTAKQIAIEVKRNNVVNADIKQLRGYVDELGEECVAGALIGRRVAGNIEVPSNYNFHLWEYDFGNIDIEKPHTFRELLSNIQISKVR